MRWLPLLGAVLFVALSCAPSLEQVTPGASPLVATATSQPVSPISTTTAERIIPPDRDLYSLTRRLRGVELAPGPTLPVPTPFFEGREDTFWVTNLEEAKQFQVSAVLRRVTPHAYFYVAKGVDVADAALDRSARQFEERIYPKLSGYFGRELLPGIDEDEHLTILHADIPGVGGYFSSVDEYPSEVYPFSNEREMIYINVVALAPGTTSYYSTLAHELQHAAHFRADVDEDTWVNEGLGELATDLSGYRVFSNGCFARSPDVQLTAWSLEPTDVCPHYGAAYRFVKYLAQHYGGYEALTELVEEKADGIRGIDNYLRAKGYAASFESVFRDWVVANYLDDPAGGPFSYDDAFSVSALERLGSDGSLSGRVHQYGADYIGLGAPLGEATVSFDGSDGVRLMPAEPHSGAHFWWSHRGDAIDSTLTREFDLIGLERATLSFWLWYEIEENWDYAYVEASADGGQSWDILSGRHTTTENPLALAFGPGYSGTSGGGGEARWVEERIDLTPYVGRKVLVRFEYVTDEALNKTGLFIDDISVPELGYFDDAEGKGGPEVEDSPWRGEGFVRTSNWLKQRFSVRLVIPGEPPQVIDMALDEDNRGELTFSIDAGARKQPVLVVSALAPLTTEVADYRVRLTPVP